MIGDCLGGCVRSAGNDGGSIKTAHRIGGIGCLGSQYSENDFNGLTYMVPGSLVGVKDIDS